MTKAFKASSDSQIFVCERVRVCVRVCDSAYSKGEQHTEKDILYFWQHMLFRVSLDLELGVAPAKWSESVKRLPVDRHAL